MVDRTLQVARPRRAESGPRVLRIQTTELYQWTMNSHADVVIHVGGAGSGKSYATARAIITRLYSEPGCKILVTRKTLPALKITAEKIVVDMLKTDGMYRVGRHNKTDRIYTHTNGAFILFSSTDDPEKRKSEEWNYVWMEEGTEFGWDDYRMITTRMRAKKTSARNQIIITLNPSDEYHWTHTKLEGQPHVDVFYSTVDNNPFADPEYVETLDRMAEVDEVFYRVMRLGQWATTQGLIFTNWTSDATHWQTSRDIWGGLDFGFTNPTAMVEMCTTHDDTNLHVRECLYERGMTNADLISWLVGNWNSDRIIYADAAEPDRIEEIRRAGFRIFPATKDVRLGIDFLKRFKIRVHESGNLETELRAYRWRTYRGELQDEPLKVNDHAIDALRYGAFSHLYQPDTEVRYDGYGGRFTKLGKGAF